MTVLGGHEREATKKKQNLPIFNKCSYLQGVWLIWIHLSADRIKCFQTWSSARQGLLIGDIIIAHSAAQAELIRRRIILIRLLHLSHDSKTARRLTLVTRLQLAINQRNQLYFQKTERSTKPLV